ncbi:MAG: hypothetical protein PW734_10235 [Verrucomicrobium sp.]|nr:hypothetical protein [Verrucomicrobium sp.]
MARPSTPWRTVTRLSAADVNVDATLRSGQAFCWTRHREVWEGWIGPAPCRIGADGAVLGPAALKEEAVRRYFGLDVDLDAALGTFPADAWLAEATLYAPRLRLLAQEPWETLASFICSAVKQIPQIEQINQTLRRRFGPPWKGAPGLHGFPTPAAVAEAGEAALRECRLGFRARSLHGTAARVAAGEVDLQALHALPTDAAREVLVGLPGVGPKIADCVLLFAYRRYDAFPIDVWVERVLRQLYFTRRRPDAARLRAFSQSYFGPYRGYAQQYLFHWVRTARPPAAMAPLRKPKKRRIKRLAGG